MITEQTLANLRALRIGGMALTLPARYQQAKANDLDYIDFLNSLLEDEMAKRKDNLLNRRIKLANFPQLKTLDEFNWDFNSCIPKRTLIELAASQFIHEAENVLFIGPPGVGKSHLAIALGLSAIHNGNTVLYKSAFDLVDEMGEAYRNENRKKYVQALTRQNLLVIDEFGMKKMPQNAADDILEVIHRRYGVMSTIIATNRPIEDWGKILGDNAATSAILDRFLDRARIITINGKSYRMRKGK